MKFLILSDLHLEFRVAYAPPTDCAFDAVFLAGDITSKGDAVVWAVSVFGSDIPIVVVPGNHEYYDGCLPTMREKFQKDARGYANVHVLDPGEVVLSKGRIRVLGCTLWTDFKIQVETTDGPQSHFDYAVEQAWRFINDYKCILLKPPGRPERLFEPYDSFVLHERERLWLLDKLQQPFEGATVVVTHHGPSVGSVAPQWADNWLTPAFSSNLPDAYFEVPALWVHGHTHSSRDYRRGNTRVICNPRGYPLRRLGFENPEFDDALVVDVAPT